MGEILQTDQMAPSPELVAYAARLLREGQVVVAPTDSVYGLVCAATPENPAHRRIFEIKKREISQTLPLFIADPEDIDVYGQDIAPWARTLARRFWPGALTLVVRSSSKVAPEYVASDGTCALRVPNSELVRELTRACGGLMANTSANIHGFDPATSGASVAPAIVEAVALTLDAGAAPEGVPSTIVASRDGEPVIVREGAIPKTEIFAALT